MEQYDVYRSRDTLTDPLLSISKSVGKKRDKLGLTSDGIKLPSLKIARQSPSHDEESAQIDSNTMGVLPRLLRDMANGSGKNSTGLANNTVVGRNSQQLLPDTPTNSSIDSINHTNPALNDTDSSSSASSFISTPSTASTSSIISFLTPGQLDPITAIAAAAALSTPSTTSATTTTPVGIESSESSGLVTLAAASSMFEKEWLARSTALCQDGSTTSNIPSTAPITTVTLTTSDLHPSNNSITLTVEHPTSGGERDGSGIGSPPILFKTLTSSANPHISDPIPVTRTLLDVQSLAVLLHETQKQRAASTTPVEPSVPLNQSVMPSDNGLTSCVYTQQLPSPTLGTSVVHSTTTAIDDNPENPMPVEPDSSDTGGGSVPQAAFISLQPAPGSLLSSSDLQQLMANGEFMTSAARQTLLGQTTDGKTRQLYLLVPSDCPVIMSRTSAKPETSPSPLVDTSNTAPILEAISPGIEPEENCNQLPPVIPSAASPQPVTLALPQLAGAMLTPMSCTTSTALSTLIAGLEARNQLPHQSNYMTSSSTAAWSTPSGTTVPSVDSSRIRLPIQLPGVSLSDRNNLIPNTDHNAAYPNGSATEVGAELIGVKSDPDMYTPNGHPYPALEEINRFRSYPSYSQSGAAHVGTLNSTIAVTNPGFFQQQQDLSNPLLLPQSNLLNATSIVGVIGGGTVNNNADGNNNNNLAAAAIINANSNNNGGGVTMINAHHLSSANTALQRVNSAFATSSNHLPISSTAAAVAASSILPTLNRAVASAGQLEECRRNMTNSLLTAGAAPGRTDQGQTTYLEHLNPEAKDVRRRVSHNEVERRRRDRINTWISELYKLLPPDEQAKSQYQSKGIVLKRVCEYFQNVDSMLKNANAAVDQARLENNVFRQRIRDLEQENRLLSASLQLGAAAAAAHLQNQQPRTTIATNVIDEVTSAPVGHNGAGVQQAPQQQIHQQEHVDTGDYANGVTVFSVNVNNEDNSNNNNCLRGTNFSQSNCLFVSQPSQLSSTSFATLSTANAVSNVFTIRAATPITPTSSMVNPSMRTLTLPSLDIVANRSENRPE